MYGRAEGAVDLGNKLTLQHILADPDDWLRRIADMLTDRQYQLSGHRYVHYRPGRRLRFVGVQAQPAMQFSEVVSRCAHDTLRMLMQSTGHGAMQSSQPVHSD